MGTRSTVVIRQNRETEPLLTLNGMWDGDFDGVGNDIIEFLHDKEMTNGGMPLGATDMFNGIGDLALQLAHALKQDEIGSWYAVESGYQEHYHYEISESAGEVLMSFWMGDILTYDQEPVLNLKTVIDLESI